MIFDATVRLTSGSFNYSEVAPSSIAWASHKNTLLPQAQSVGRAQLLLYLVDMGWCSFNLRF